VLSGGTAQIQFNYGLTGTDDPVIWQ